MEIEFDPAKNERNIQIRGLPFAMAADFDFETALVVRDERRDYGEPRWIALGRIGSRGFVLAYTWRGGDRLRVISLRKANDREIARYEQTSSRGSGGGSSGTG